MPKAILFDFDGTLADTVPAIAEGVNLTMRRFGYPTHSEEAVRGFVSRGARHLIRSAMPAHLSDNEELLNTVLADFTECYRAVHLQTQSTYPGMKELVERLHGHFRIGVLSNKPHDLLYSLTEHVLTPGSWDAAQGVLAEHPTKPHPYLTLRVTSAMGVLPADCVLVGDSDIDLLTAQNAGMPHIGVTWGYRSADYLLSHGVTRLAHSPAELERLILEVMGE